MNLALAKKIARTSPAVVWFIARGSVLKGPYTTEQLKDKVHKRELSYFDFCWRQGFEEWRPLSSVEDFERRNRARRIPTYPAVEVPSSGKSESTVSSAPPSNVIPFGRRHSDKKAQINFAKMRRHSITAYEWAAAIMFSVALAYMATSFALNEVQSYVLKRVSVLTAGYPQSLGESNRSVAAAFWEPLYSAPSFSDTATLPAYARQRDVVGDLPVRVHGQAMRDPSGKTRVGAYLIDSPNALPLWKSGEKGVDPVYSRSVDLKGYLSPKNGGVVMVREPGDPGLLTNP